ncbi:hypothetical protein AALP_AA3G096100 [Arabis alpina]|uniref:PROP1-like PPR domain-containing protein n=1 Tax=Arabis alpina TaxID=50452 RepID=A0A087H847_ARAAL|nr:hypothetical protein AALP_AA3G096100 [Arabis alpina]
MVIFPKSLSPKHVLKLLKSEKNLRSAFDLFDSATRHPGYAHSAVVFHHILRRLSEARMVSLVSRVVDIIRSQECKCDEDIALSVLKSYGNNSMPDRALDVFKRMGEIFGCEPGIRSYNTLLNAFVEAKQWDKVESLLAYFETEGLAPNLQTYNVLIKMSCKKKQFEKAKGFLDLMWKEGLKPDVRSYSTVINELVKGGNLVDALEVFDEMSDRGDRKIDLALALWHQFLQSGQKPDVTMHNILIHGLCSVGKLDDAINVVVNMEHWNCAGNLVTYNTLMKGFFKVGDSNSATVIWGYMYKMGLQPDIISYNIILNGLCMCHRVSYAIEFFDDARSHGIFPTVVTWNILVRAVVNR